MRRIVILSALGLLSPVAVMGQARELPFSDPGWIIQGPGQSVESLMGFEAFRIRNGAAVRTDIPFQDGTIEFDLAVESFRSFIGLRFRVQENGDAEEIYFRPHKNRLPDAFQYTPVFDRLSYWQIYHGPGCTAAVEYPEDGGWAHVRVEVQGRSAAVFYDDQDEPLIRIPLAREPAEGAFIVYGSLGTQLEAGIYAGSVANFVVKPGVVEYDFSVPLEPPDIPDGLIDRWHLSHAFAVDPAGAIVREIPSRIMESDGWTVGTPDDTGLLPFGRYVTRDPAAQLSALLAKVVVRSERDQTKRLDFGFSDIASVFVNGELVYSGNHIFSNNFPRRQGLVTLDQASLYLPLKEGDNEIIVAVTEAFGGWGITGAFEDLEGLEIR